MTIEETVAQCQAHWVKQWMAEMCAIRDELYGKPERTPNERDTLAQR